MIYLQAEIWKKKESEEKSIFSICNIEKNFDRLCSIPRGNIIIDQLSVLNGVRVISMLWIIMGHVFLGQMLNAPLDINVNQQFAHGGAITKFIYQIIPGAEFAVDTFFFLSGLLVVNSLLSVSRKAGDRVPYVLAILHRYIRLTPAYAFSLLVYSTVSTYISDGPYWPIETQFSAPAQKCPKSWWKNLLYINNVAGDLRNDCMGWAWYLPNNFSLYIYIYIYTCARTRVEYCDFVG